MFRLAGRPFVGAVFAFFAAAACLALFSPAPAQDSPGTTETEVPILRSLTGKRWNCFFPENAVFDEGRMRDFEKNPRYKECPRVRGLLKVNFARHTLITYEVGGDCHVRWKTRVFRDDAAKKYTVRIKTFWGGCRAAGRHQNWLLVEKIPPGYAVDFAYSVGEKDLETGGGSGGTGAGPQIAPARDAETDDAPEVLETVRYDMDGCVPMYFRHDFVVRDRETFLKTIRNDASRDRCLRELKKIDFGRHSLLGTVFSSGYCRTPLYSVETVKDPAKKRYVFTVSYPRPEGVCRHLSQHEAWVLVPKLPEGWEVRFEKRSLGRRTEK